MKELMLCYLHVSSIVMEVNKTAHILVFCKYNKRLKRKIKTPKSVKIKFNY